MSRVAIVGSTACAAVVAAILGGIGTVIDVLDRPAPCGAEPRHGETGRAVTGECGERADTVHRDPSHFGGGTALLPRFSF